MKAVAPAAIDNEGDFLQMQLEHAKHAFGSELVLDSEPVRVDFPGEARAVLLVQCKLALQLLLRTAVLLDFGTEVLLEMHHLGRAPRHAPTAFPGGADQRQHRGEQNAGQERDPLPVELGEEYREHQQHDQDQRDQRRQQHAHQRSKPQAVALVPG